MFLVHPNSQQSGKQDQKPNEICHEPSHRDIILPNPLVCFDTRQLAHRCRRAEVKTRGERLTPCWRTTQNSALSKMNPPSLVAGPSLCLFLCFVLSVASPHRNCFLRLLFQNREKWEREHARVTAVQQSILERGFKEEARIRVAKVSAIQYTYLVHF